MPPSCLIGMNSWESMSIYKEQVKWILHIPSPLGQSHTCISLQCICLSYLLASFGAVQQCQIVLMLVQLINCTTIPANLFSFQQVDLIKFRTFFLFCPPDQFDGRNNRTRQSHFYDKKKKKIIINQGCCSTACGVDSVFVTLQINLIVVFVIREKGRLSKWM